MAIDVSSPSSHPAQNAFHRLAGLARQAAPPLFTALAYVLAAKAGAWLAFPSAPVSAFWAPNAILLAALLLTRRERWWLYLLAVLPFHFLVQLPAAPARAGRDPVRRERHGSGARRLGAARTLPLPAPLRPPAAPCWCSPCSPASSRRSRPASSWSRHSRWPGFRRSSGSRSSSAPSRTPLRSSPSCRSSCTA